jgi:hypothetical protein
MCLRHLLGARGIAGPFAYAGGIRSEAQRISWGFGLGSGLRKSGAESVRFGGKPVRNRGSIG